MIHDIANKMAESDCNSSCTPFLKTLILTHGSSPHAFSLVILMILSSQGISPKVNGGTSNNLKVLHSGTQEFKRATEMRDLFLEFISHYARLHSRLALEEGRVYTDEQLD